MNVFTKDPNLKKNILGGGKGGGGRWGVWWEVAGQGG